LQRFIGVDLAWAVDSKHTGIAVLEGTDRSTQLIELSEGIHSLEGVVEFVTRNATSDTVVAIDASLIVNNDRGQRPCETAIARTFAKSHAGCHSTNRRRPHFDSGIRLVNGLGKHGFVHDFQIRRSKRRPGQWIFEVYPHPAMIRLFGLERIIQYKRRSVDARRRGLRTLQRKLDRLDGLRKNRLLDGTLRIDLVALKGQALKRYEDSLDAIFCAYLAWYCWRWGENRTEVFGNMDTGYIVVPKAPP